MHKALVHSFFWITYIIVTIVFKLNNLGFVYALEHTLVMLPIHIISFYGFGYLVVNRFFETKKWILFGVTSLLFFCFFYFLTITFIVPHYEEYYKLIPGSHVNREQRVVIITVLLSMSVSTIAHVLENKIVKEKNTQLLLNEHKEAQLMYLKAQINPHFLFNALNNIYSLSVIKSDNTPKMVLNLADLLRYSIYEGQKEKVLISDEVSHIKKYIQLFQAAQEEPVDITFDIMGEMTHQYIEPMMLIPLVENCIKHGNIASDLEAFIHINLEIKNDQLRFETLNSTNKVNVQKDKVGGVGLVNIEKRLKLKYPNDYTLEIQDYKNKFKVSLHISKLKKL